MNNDINSWLKELGINRNTMIERMLIIKKEMSRLEWDMINDEWNLPILSTTINNIKLHITISAEDNSTAILNFEKDKIYQFECYHTQEIKDLINDIIYSDKYTIESDYEELPF